MIPPEKMPYKLVGGFEYDSGDFQAVMDCRTRDNRLSNSCCASIVTSPR